MITLWHNPRCSKSRAALALLMKGDVPLTVRRYLLDVPNVTEIEAAITALDIAPIELIRRGEAAFKELGLTPDSPPKTLVQAMADHPILIERPIAFQGSRAVIGRPPEAVLELL
jgi:arsenate reductase